MDKIEISPHQWTHTGDRVLIVRCCDKDGKSHNGFQWPKAGKVYPEYCKPDTSCESGGLFGWPWGVGLGIGKDPEFNGVWIVFSAPKEQVFFIDGKVKVSANRPEDVDAEVVYFGSWHEAMELTRKGREAWIHFLTDQSASSATGYRSASSATGDRSASSATGYRSASSATGYRSASSATGAKSISAITNNESTIDCDPRGLGACTANIFFWKVRVGAIVANRFETESGYVLKILDSIALGLADGETVKVEFGEIVK